MGFHILNLSNWLKDSYSTDTALWSLTGVLEVTPRQNSEVLHLDQEVIMNNAIWNDRKYAKK